MLGCYIGVTSGYKGVAITYSTTNLLVVALIIFYIGVCKDLPKYLLPLVYTLLIPKEQHLGKESFRQVFQ